ncbi:O-antigen ligase family protein [Calothrix rhizosoleniae]|uniref:O-antigen ligase family protein n=1 Tax=Calothrix rhizosoleniae TaxID=888997 RepID=UPI000B49EFD9|nr:O-antigen ligase family protein [Calothrix rhizosoleniae]
MLKLQSSNLSSRMTFFVALGGIVVGLLVGFLTGVNPLLVGAALFSVAVLVWFFAKFEQAVILLLILRSSLDIFSDYQIPAAFAIGLDLLTVLYVTLKLLTGQRVHVDKFWWCFAGWILLQGLWIILLPLGGLGLDASYLLDGIREWVRLFSWLMIYLLVMQLKNRVQPESVINMLFFSLCIPLTVAVIQIIIPPSFLPPLLVFQTEGVVEAGSRINGTLGHPATFASFLLLFIGLTFWKISQSSRRLPWLLLLTTLVFFLVSTKALTVLAMLLVLILVLISPRLNLMKLMGGIVLFALVIGLFASTEFGQERLTSIYETPLLNPDIDISRAITLSSSDGNSFNWRIAQWSLLLEAWQHHPILGYGLNTARHLTRFDLYAHNDYIRALVEGGIVGLVSFLSIIVGQIFYLINLIYSSPRNSSKRRLCLILIGIFLGLMLGMLTDNILTHTTLFFYWFLLVAVVGWDWKEGQTDNENTLANQQLNFTDN